MINQKFNIGWVTLSLLLGVFACQVKRDVAPELPVTQTATSVLQELHTSQADYEWFSTRFSGSVLYEGNSHSISGSLRIRKDSAIYVSIAPILGIELGRALITPDSVKVLNRLQAEYYKGDLKALSHLFNADVDFYMLQALFTGNDFPNFRNDQFRLTNEPHLLKLHADPRSRSLGGGGSIRHTLMVDPEYKRIRTSLVEQKESNRALRADYSSYQSVSGQSVPSELRIIFSDQNNMSNLEMSFSRTFINEPQRIRFSVPSRYRHIHLTD